MGIRKFASFLNDANTCCNIVSPHCIKSTVCVLSQESYRQVMKMRPKDLWKRLMIKFRGEEGLDYGGVARYFIARLVCFSLQTHVFIL